DKNLDQMLKTQDNSDTATYYTLNTEFHDMLLDGAGNPRAKAMYDNMVKEMHLFRRRGLSIATNIARSIEEHRDIREAVADGDPDGARAAAERHITSGFARYMKMVEQEDQGSG
ncbi:MAG: FCD domain-containing protein, partial [Pseudomonadota bacterium]